VKKRTTKVLQNTSVGGGECCCGSGGANHAIDDATFRISSITHLEEAVERCNQYHRTSSRI
jgi:hypothetical protein